MTRIRQHVSVVVPTKDTLGLTLACLASLDQAGFDGAEVVVIDDGSTDGTADEVARLRPQTCVLRNQQTQGFGLSANRGLNAARGEILVLLNSDTEVFPGAAPALLREFGTYSDLGVIGARLEYPDGRAQWSGGMEPGLVWLFGLASGGAGLVGRAQSRVRVMSKKGNRRVEWVTGAAMAIRRRVWDEIGPFDAEFSFYGQDLDFCTRAGRAGWRVHVSSEFRVVHHHGATIRAAGRSVGAQNPEFLWSDLLRWAKKHGGAAWARRAAVTLWAGGWLRIVARRLVEPWLSPASQRQWRRDSLIFRRAIASLEDHVFSSTKGRSTVDS